MARHYGRPGRPSKQPRPKRWLWVFIAILLAGFAAFLLIVTTPQTSKKAAPTPPPINSIKKPSPEKAKPKFEFYNILPQKQIAPHKPKEATEKKKETKIIVVAPQATSKTTQPEKKSPEKTITEQNASNKKQEKPVEQKPSSYWIQIGAFQIFDDADAQKAELAFLGFPATIQTATVSGKTWFRVRSGPFKTEAKAKEAQEQLKESGITSKIVPM